MPTVVTCPRCGGDNAPTHTTGEYRCVFCGMVYAGTASSTAVASRPPAASSRVPWLLLAAALMVGLAQGVAVRVMTRVQRGADLSAEPSEAATGWVAAATPNVDAEPAETPSAAPSFSTTVHRHHPLVDKTFVYVEVTNNANYPVYAVQITDNIYDASGNLLQTGQGTPSDDVLQPGQTSPALVVVDRLLEGEVRHEVTVKALKRDFATYEVKSFRVEASSRKANYGNWAFEGTVTHEGSVPARFVSVLVVGRDAEHRIVGLHQEYVVGDGRFEPGATARFSTETSLWAAPPASFEYRASALPAEEPG